MAIFSSRGEEQPQSSTTGKTHLEFSEDVEATRTHSKSDDGRIERVELTAEEVRGASPIVRWIVLKLN